MALGPLDDPLRLADRLAVIGDEHRHDRAPGELSDFPAPVGHQFDRPDAKAADLDDLRVVAGGAQRVVGVMARMPTRRTRRLDRGPADVELHVARITVPTWQLLAGRNGGKGFARPSRGWAKPSRPGPTRSYGQHPGGRPRADLLALGGEHAWSGERRVAQALRAHTSGHAPTVGACRGRERSG